MAFLITTTGASPSTVIFYDLGERTFTHPTTNYDLETEFYIDEIRYSDDVFAAILGGSLTATYNGVDVFTQADLDSVRSDDPRLYIQNEIRVKKNPGIGEFSTITDALNSISDNSSSNRYVIQIGPGEFIEDTLVFKPYVDVVGSGGSITIITVDSPNKNVIVGSDFSNIRKVLLNGATGTGYAAIYHSSLTGTTMTAFNVEQCNFGNNDILVKAEAPGVPSAVFLNNCKYGGEYQFNYGFIATNTGSGAGRILIRNSTSSGMTAPYPTIFAISDGVGTEIIMNSVQSRVPVAGTGIGIKSSNGGRLRLLSVNLRGFAIGIEMENVGAASTISSSSVILENCTQDLNIAHPGASGNFDGFIDRINSFIDPSSEVVINSLDSRIIRVAKLDTDYNSVKEAIDSITDASPYNRYVIAIGPGVFNEDPFSLKPYIEITGSGADSTYLLANDPSVDFITTSGNSTLKNIKFGGTSDPGKSIFVHTGDPIAGSLNVVNCNFTNTDRILTQTSTSGPSICLFQNCSFDSLSYFTTGFHVSDNGIYPCLNGISSFSWLADSSFFPSPAVFEDFVKISGSFSKCIASNLYVGTDIGNIGGDCYHVLNGATLNLSDLQFHGFDRAIYSENAGTAPTVTITSAQLINNITDILIEHPSTTGSFQGSANMSKVTIDPSSEFNISIQDFIEGSFNISNRLNVRFPNGTLTDVSTLIVEAGTMGVMEGGELTASGSPAFKLDIADGFGYIEQFPDQDFLKRIDWPNSSIVLAPNTINFVFFNYNGILTVDSTVPDTFFNILLGRVVTNSDGIEFIDASPLAAEHIGNRFSTTLRHAIGSVFVSGSAVTEHDGSPSLPFHLDVSQGHYHFAENVFHPSGGSDIEFISFYKDGLGGFVRTSTNVVDSDNYDDGSGTLAPLSSGYYAKHTLYVVGEGINEKYFLVYGQEEFSALTLAEQGNIPNPPASFDEGVVLISSIIVKQGVSNITEIQDLRPIIGFRAPTVSAATFHGNLLGLTNDDHPQYLLVNGTRAMTGNLSLGGNSITNVNLVDGVDVSSHASRHLPNGADPLTTAAAVSVDGSNTEGIANSFARSDHQHTIASNTVTDAMVSSHTSTKITITAKGQLNSAIVYNDQANTYGDFNQIFRSSRLIITNPANTFNYTFVGSAIVAARNVTIPLLTSDDTLVTENFIQSITNKTFDNTNTATLKDTLFTLQDDGDNSKQLKFQLSGISTATTRTLTIPDADGVIVIRDAVYENTLTTTNATATTITTLPTSTDTAYLAEVRGNCRRVSGTGAGVNGDSNVYVRTFKYKNVGGTVTTGTIQSSFTDEDIAAHNITFVVSGTNVLVQVAGSTNNTVHWKVISDIIVVA